MLGEQTSRITIRSLKTRTQNSEILDGEDVDVLKRPVQKCTFQTLDIEVGDGCWRQSVLVSHQWWQHWDAGDNFEMLVFFYEKSHQHQIILAQHQWSAKAKPKVLFSKSLLDFFNSKSVLLRIEINYRFYYTVWTEYDGTSTERNSNELMGIFHLAFHHIRFIL